METASATHDVELAQARIRPIVAALCILYVGGLRYWALISSQQFYQVLAFSLPFMLISLVRIGWIQRRPGLYPSRRALAIVFDYVSIGYSLSVVGEPMLPVFGAMLWVTVGNGMRYGSRYLALATLIALLTIAAVVLNTHFLLHSPYVLLTMIITTLVVPAYAHILLERTRQASERAQAANVAKSRFLAQASHDLRQPIHSISLFTACLRDARLGIEERRMVENIDRSLNSVSQLFRSILDHYTLDNGNVRPQIQPMPLQALLDDIRQQNAETARWAGVTLRIHATSLQVTSDPNLLATMLQNLVSNAIKYAQGKPVLIGCRLRNGAVTLEVRDAGKGIPEAQLSLVFDEFYRVRAVRDKDVEGLGLGLSIVRRIGELLGLTVTLRSRLGTGTCASINGLSRAAPRVSPISSDNASRAIAASPLNGLHVLLIEDDQNVLLATATLLQRWGCRVTSATTIPNGPVECDLVITDFDLDAQASGADCIAYLRRLSGWQIPAVVISGHDVARVEQAVADPGVPVLAKPVHPAELRSLLASLKLQRKRPTLPA
ncbi:hybrid sensor histidine kinase/response regulator [Stutzerimonas stutzeri]